MRPRLLAATDELEVGDTLPLDMRPDALGFGALRRGDLDEGRMGRVGDRVAIRVMKPLPQAAHDYAMF